MPGGSAAEAGDPMGWGLACGRRWETQTQGLPLLSAACPSEGERCLPAVYRAYEDPRLKKGDGETQL